MLAAVLIMLLLWLVSGALLASLALTLAGFVVWLYYRLACLEAWLERGTKLSEVYDDRGIFAEIIRHLYHQRKIHSRRKKRTKDIIRRLHRNIAALPDATILLNDQLEIEWSNAPAQYLLGIDQRQDIGQRISNLIRHPEFLRYLISPDNKEQIELESPIDNSSTLQIKIVRFGRNQRLVSARNISDQKQLQESLKNFVANASHELKTPLTTISGHLEMLSDEKHLSKSGRKSVKAASQQSRRMQRLINDLLLLSQVESYQLQPNEGVRTSLAEIMANVSTAVDSNCNDGVLSCTYPENLALLCIKAEVESICINLVDNAIKYSAEGNAEIQLQWFENDRGECVLKVTDHGIGISERDLPYITERYFRGSHSLTATVTGSGLGLAIVKQAAAKHGATLSVNSRLNQGSTFTVTFPSYRTLHKDSKQDNIVHLAQL